MSAPHDILAIGGDAVFHPGLYTDPDPAGATMNTDNPVGTGDLTGAHNVPLHIGGFLILSVIVVIVLQVLGFRFVVSANIGMG